MVMVIGKIGVPSVPGRIRLEMTESATVISSEAGLIGLLADILHCVMLTGCISGAARFVRFEPVPSNSAPWPRARA